MPKHRSFKLEKFIKSADDALLREYFRKWDVSVPGGLVFDSGEGFDRFWDSIENDRRIKIEESLQCINDTADKARDCLELACREFSIEKQDDETSETTAIRVYLKGDEAFSLAFDAYLYYVLAEKMSHHKFKNVTIDFGGARVAQFKSAVEQFFKGCGKSDHCDIRQRRDGDKRIFLVARGDYVRTHLVFNDQQGKTDIKSFRPAKEDMLVFGSRNNILSLNLSGRSDEVKKRYIEMFGHAFLGVDRIDEETLNGSLVDVEPIKNRTFSFGGNEYIESVTLTEVSAKMHNGAMRLVLRSNDLANTRGYGIGFDGAAEFVSVKLKFFIKREGKKSKRMTVEIKPPENSRIPQKKEKQIIEEYLREQGVLLV